MSAELPAALVPRRRLPLWANFLLLAVGLGGGFWVGHTVDRAGDRSPPAAPDEGPPADATLVTLAPDKQAAAGVEAVPVAPEPFAWTVWRPGKVTLDEDRVAHVCPPAEGVVHAAPVRLGQTVAAGDVLAVLESREFLQTKLDFLKAKAALATEREHAARTTATMTNAQELLALLAADTPLPAVEKALKDKPIGDWRQQLVTAYTKRNQLKADAASKSATRGVVPELQVQKAAADLDAAEAGYAALVEEMRFQARHEIRRAELKLKEAETALDVARTHLLVFGLTADAVARLDPTAEGAAASHLAIKAPFAGTVVEKHAVLSERVGPQSQLFVLADLSAVWVQADLFEPDLPLLRSLADRPVVFRTSADGFTPRSAKVLYAGDLIDKASRSLTLTAEAANPSRDLKPGLFVEVGFQAGDQAPAVLLPAAAVLRHDNRPFVFVQTGEAAFRRTDVTLGRPAGDRVEVVRGLTAGERVVVKGAFTLKSELLKDQMVGE